MIHERSNGEFTVAQKLNQGERKKWVVYHFFLDFFCYFFVSRQKSKYEDCLAQHIQKKHVLKIFSNI